MMLITSVILSFLFCALSIILISSIYKRSKKINMIIIFVLSLILFNGIIPVFLLNEATNSGFSNSLGIVGKYSILDICLYYFQNVMLLTSAVFGWLIMKKHSLLCKDIEISKLTALNCKTIRRVSIFFLILSVLCYYLYSMAFGGFVNLLAYTAAIRSGIIRSYNPFSFLQKFGGFTLLSTLLLCGLIIEKSYKKSDVAWFVFSLIFSTYYLYSLGGRASFVAFFASIGLGYVFYKYENKITLKLIMKSSAIACGIILGLYFLTRIFSRETSDLSIISFFAQELSFPMASFKLVTDQPHVFWFKHVILSPLYFLPSSIWDLKLGFDTASSFNTILFMGAPKGENGVTGSIPLDVLSFSWLEGGIIGGVFVGLIFGSLLAILQKVINDIPNRGIKSLILSYASIKFAVMTVNYGDTVHIIQGDFAFIAGFCMLAFLLKKNIKKIRKLNIIKKGKKFECLYQ